MEPKVRSKFLGNEIKGLSIDYAYNAVMGYVDEKEIKVVRKRKQAEKQKEKKAEKLKPRPVFKIGDRVRLMDGKAVGSIDSLEKNKAVVNYGIFTTNVSVDQLELVESKK